MKIKKGDKVYCKRPTTQTLINNSVIVFRVGEKCSIQDANYLGKTMIILINGNELFFVVEKFHEQFETINERRERIIENLI